MAQKAVLFEIHSNNLFIDRKHNRRFCVGNKVSFARDVMGKRHNQRTARRTYKESTPDPPRTVIPFARITTEEKDLPRRPGDGYVFGSDPKKCDIFIGTRGEGVSGKHFTIQLHERAGVLIVKDISSHGTAARQPNDKHPEPIRPQIILERGDHNCSGIMHIHIPGNIQIELRLPIATLDQTEFEAAWSKVYQICQEDQRSIASLDLAPPPSSTQAPVSSYVLKQCIGHCETGDVYSAAHRIDRKQLFTVKRWKEKAAAEHEVHVLSRIEHAYIVRFIEYVAPLQFDKDAEVIMEHLDGRSLSQEHSRSPFHISELKIVASQVANALRHVHGLGYVHGDISQETIWLKARQPIHVKLFGFKAVNHDHAKLTVVSAPEVRKGKKFTSKADIWSFGITLMMLLFDFPRKDDGNVSYDDLICHLVTHSGQYESSRRFLFSLLQETPDMRPEGKHLVVDEFFAKVEGDRNVTLPLVADPEVFNNRESGDDTESESIPDTAIPDGIAPVKVALGDGDINDHGQSV